MVGLTAFGAFRGIEVTSTSSRYLMGRVMGAYKFRDRTFFFIIVDWRFRVRSLIQRNAHGTITPYFKCLRPWFMADRFLH